MALDVCIQATFVIYHAAFIGELHLQGTFLETFRTFSGGAHGRGRSWVGFKDPASPN